MKERETTIRIAVVAIFVLIAIYFMGSCSNRNTELNSKSDKKFEFGFGKK